MSKQAVSSGNPCPFLRALVSEGLVNDKYEPVSRLAETIVKVARTGEGKPELPFRKIVLIAVMANGLSPFSAARNAVKGTHLSGLRDGPLDKKGVGSQILDENGGVSLEQLERMESFGSLKAAPDGQEEMGLSEDEIVQFMEANWQRGEGKRRKIDRRLMDGEWPFLLKVMGIDSAAGRYLSMKDVRSLIIDHELPERMLKALA